MSEVVTRTIDDIVDSVTIQFEPQEIQARYLAVDIEILERANEVGVANYAVYVPRLWSGYWYLTNNESVIESGAIQWTRARIYQKEYHGTLKLLNEVYRVSAAAWKLQEGTFDPLPDPLEPFSDIYKAHKEVSILVANALSELSECGSSLAHLVSDLRLYVPLGVVLKVKIHHLPYCLVAAIDPATDELELVEDNPQKPLEPINPPLDMVPQPRDFDEIVRDRGWIRPDECSTPEDAIDDLIENDDPLKKFLVSYRVFNSASQLIQTVTNRVFWCNREPVFAKKSGQFGDTYYSILAHSGISYSAGAKTAFGAYSAASSASPPALAPGYGVFYISLSTSTGSGILGTTYIVDSVNLAP